MSAFNHYEKTRSLAGSLLSEGHYEWAQRVTSAIEEGFTATEILMAIRWNLEELRAARVDLSPKVHAAVNELLREIDGVLNRGR